MSAAAQPTVNLLDFDPAGLAAFVASAGEKPFRAKQLSRWLHQRFAGDVESMTDLAKSARKTLAERATIAGPTVIRDSTAADGTRKWLLDAGGGNAVEAVYIPEDDRGTLCISSQAGCALDCAKSARIVPAAAFAGSVAPMRSRFFRIAPSPSSTWIITGPEIMKSTRSLKNGRAR